MVSQIVTDVGHILNKKSVLKATLIADYGCYIFRDAEGKTVVSLPQGAGRVVHADALVACLQALVLLGGAK